MITVKKPKGKQAFLDYYQRIFPNSAEFDQFIKSLLTPFPPILRFHPENETKLRQLWRDHRLPWKTLTWYPYALQWPPKVPLKTPLPGFNERLFYATAIWFLWITWQIYC